MADRRPNIIVTICDDQRHSAIGSLGETACRTPHLDRLAERGTAFTRAHLMGSTVGAVCAPSRAMLHTGQSLWHVNPMIYQPSLAREEQRDAPPAPTLGQLLQEAGYHTHGIGKWHNGRQTYAASFSSGDRIFFGGMSDHFQVPCHDFDPTGRYPNDRRYLGDKHSTELFCEPAVRFLHEYDDDRPFFLYVAWTAPHDPRSTLPEYHAQYPADAIELPPNCLPEHPFDNGDLSIRDEVLAASPRNPDDIRQHVADYYAMTTHMDDAVGRIHAALEASGQADNTVVVHTADHGLAVGQHGLLGKQNMYDHSMRVPLLVAGQDIPAGERCEALCYQHDLFPTVLEWAGAQPSEQCEFLSLRPHLAGGGEARSSIFSAYSSRQRMVREDRYKLIEYLVKGVRTTQLFDLAADPWETTNLAADPAQADRVAQLRSQLQGWRDCCDDPDGWSL